MRLGTVYETRQDPRTGTQTVQRGKSVCKKKTDKRLQDTGGHKRGTGMERRVTERSHKIKFCMQNSNDETFFVS